MRFLLAALLPLVLTAQDLPLKAGLARIELTPAGSMPMYGYSNRKCGNATGTHDPLHAKVLVLESGDSKIAIVTMDLGSFVGKTIHEQVKTKLGIPVLLLSASHTHSGPAFIAPSHVDAAYHAEVESKIFNAVKQASEAMFPARLAISKGSAQLGYNRLVLREDGRARALFDNLERLPLTPIDPEYTVLHVQDETGKDRALIVHYAVHAVVMGSTNCLYSADYPGVLQAEVEKAIPGAQCMFVQGGAGDINPLFMARTGNSETDFGIMTKHGQTLAASVLRTVRKPTALSANRHPIQTKSQIMTFPDRWDKSKTIDVGISTVLINREIAIAALPGEPMHKLQVEWKQKADVAYPLFYGYTYSSGGEWPGYIPDLKTAAYGGYGADVSTRIAIGAGESIMQRHLIQLFDLLGMWKDQPGRP